MKRLFKYMGMYWKAVLLILLLLCGQAYCDLSLPGYTSDIVNVGIQQGGIEESVPKAISKEKMGQLLMFLDDDSKQEVLDAYEEDETTYDKEAYVLKESLQKNDEKYNNLKDLLSMPMMECTAMESDSPMSEQVQQMMQAAQHNPQILATGYGTDGGKVCRPSGYDLGSGGDQLCERGLSGSGNGHGSHPASVSVYHGCKDAGSWHFVAWRISILVGLLASRVGASAGRDLRSRVFRKVVGFSNNEFDHFSTASLITRSTNDIQQIQMLMVMLLRIVLYAPILALGGVYKVFQTNVSMSWIIALAVILIGLVVLVLFTVAMPKFKSMQTLVDKLNLVTREILTGLSVIRAFDTEKHEEERFDQANRNLTKTNLFVNRAMTFMMPVMMLIMNGVSVLIVWTGSHGISDGQMQVGDMMAFIQYTMQIIMGFLMICMISIMLPRAAVSAERVDEILTSETMIHDPEQPKRLTDAEKGVLKFDHVSFRYPGAEEEVLSDISFTAEPGKTTAIIGSTGSGKSTLLNLIPRFYDVTEGKITLGGKDIRDISQRDLREELGYVPQKGVLFSGTIGSNIMYGNPNGSEQEMIEAAQVAQAEEFIETKKHRYESHIAQGGANVSGGQKQRLSIARAIAKHPQVFLFDDSFSALDYKTDAVLRQALKEHTENATVLIVAQRISTILHADQILVLDDGKIAGAGTHEELLKSCEVYQQIAASQLSEEELKGGAANE